MNTNPSKDDRTRRSHPHHVRSQGPVPAASVHVENDNYQGQILPETEKIAREQKAQDGVPALRNLKLGKGAGGFGAELEMVFIDKQSFRSAPVAREVLKHYEESGCDDATATPEFGLHDGELNLRPILERDPNCLDIMARRLNSSGRQLVKSAAASGALVLPVGIPPGLMAADLNQGLITPNPRFYDLDRSLMHQWEQAWKSGKKEEVDYLVDTDRGGFRVRLAEKEFTVAGPEGVINLDISNKVRYALFNTSFQVHFGVEDQSRYAEYHAYAELLVPIMVGLCANSPEAAGVMTGVLCQRGLFTAVALDPDRVFLEKSWLRDPLQQLEAAAAQPAILGRGFKNKSLGREDLDPVAVLLEQHKTTWPFVRVVPEIKQDGTIVYRIEFRPMDTQPTNKDQMSVATTVLGLLDGLKQYLADRRISFAVDVPAEEINKRLDYNKHRYHNYLKGCCRGLDACFDWFDGERVLLRDILKGMINSAEAGLQSRGISEVSYGPYLETIKRRLYSGGNGKMGGTPADLMKLLWAGHYNGDAAETAKYLNQYLADVHIIGLETGLDFLQIWDKHNPLKRPRIFT